MEGKYWVDVKNEIEEEIDRIWWEEPEEVKKCRLGIYPSGAGTDSQVFGNLFFLASDTRSMGFWTVNPIMQSVIQDSSFSLNNCKQLWIYANRHMATFLGGKSPNKPIPYLNLETMYNFCMDIIDAFDSITTKDQFSSLIWSWGNYVNALHKWFFLIFPWEIGNLFPRVENKDVTEMIKLHQE